jgi:hypothetical protein
MAGNWIKMRHDLIDAPEIRRLARATGLDRDQVYGKLFRLWSWADRHGVNGHLDAELEDLDEQVGQVGFGAALVSAGWLVPQDSGVVIPHWERHFSDSAKVRALGQNRAEKHRNAGSVTPPHPCVTQGALPEERRGDKRRIPPPPREKAAPGAAEKAPGAQIPASEDETTLLEAWKSAAKAGHAKPHRSRQLPEALADRLAEAGWLDDALAAIGHLPRCRYFKTPVTLNQLCLPGFAARVVNGDYDDVTLPKAGRPALRALDEPAPPREWRGTDAERFEATKRALAERLQVEAS